MESTRVYHKLLEIFPQVDSRILKAVALEHFNDCDKAAEFILYEVISLLPSEPRQDYVSSNLPSLEAKGKNIIDVLADNHSSSLSSDEENLDSGASEPEKQLVEIDDAASVSSQFSDKATSVVDDDSALKNIDDAFDGSEEYQSANLPNQQSELLECNNNESVSAVDEGLSMLLPTQSGHVIAVDVLEDCVADAKSSKNILVTAVESVVNMIKEAELLEERAKRAKEEAFFAGQETLAKVDELRQMLQHAKQANDMHAGEVHGEKSILSTEARELQSRLLIMANERDKSFLHVEEIRKKLETRLLAAKDEIAAAEKEKLEKEGLALKALKEQEAIMQSVVQESKKLQAEAEENAKLREFLMDRGRVVDTLHGEIAVICEDVLLLKRRVDEHGSLKGSLLITPYSSLSSASSSVSSKSVLSANEGLPEGHLGKSTVDDGHDFLTSHEQVNMSEFNNMEKVGASGWKVKSISDDEWEILRNEVGQF